MFIFTIKSIREKQGISLRKLSKITNISRAYLYDLENNRKTNPTLDKLYNISIALNVNIKDLFYSQLDIKALKKIMNSKINKFGIDSNEVLEISQLIDLLLNLSK